MTELSPVVVPLDTVVADAVDATDAPELDTPRFLGMYIYMNLSFDIHTV
jgi:hypothetical protein